MITYASVISSLALVYVKVTRFMYPRQTDINKYAAHRCITNGQNELTIVWTRNTVTLLEFSNLFVAASFRDTQYSDSTVEYMHVYVTLINNVWYQLWFNFRTTFGPVKPVDYSKTPIPHKVEIRNSPLNLIILIFYVFVFDIILYV